MEILRGRVNLMASQSQKIWVCFFFLHNSLNLARPQFPFCEMDAIQCYRVLGELFASWNTHIYMYMYICIHMYLSKHTYMNVNPYIPQLGEMVSASHILSRLSHTDVLQCALVPVYLSSFSLSSISRLQGMPPRTPSESVL